MNSHRVRQRHDEAYTSTLLELLIQQIPWGVLTIDARGGDIVMANDEMRRIWGIPGLGTYVAPRLDWRGRRPEGNQVLESEWPHRRALAGYPVTDPEDIEIVRPDGGRRLVRISAVPIDAEDGTIAAVMVTCVDISEQRDRASSRECLAKANSLLASAPDLDYRGTLQSLARLAVPALGDWCTIDLVSADGRLERVAIEHPNPRKARAAAELSRRYPPRLDRAVGVARSVMEGRSSLVRDVTPSDLDDFTQTTAGRRLLEVLGIRSLMVVPLVTRGRTIGAIAFASAESGRRYSEADLEIAEELAGRAALAIENARLTDESRAASTAKSDFLAVMSHELRTPLTAIIGYAELLQMGVPEPVTPRQHDQAERIEVSARHLLQLIEEILTLVTLESGEDRNRDRSLDVGGLLNRVAAIIEPIARTKGLALRIDPPGAAETLQTDPDKLLQVLLNLLSNAVKFTDQGEVHLSARRVHHELVFEVSDTGIGLDTGDLERIFEPFWQVERPITRKAGGTGLGLAITRRLVDILGGAIEVESTLGKGSVFRIRIPTL